MKKLVTILILSFLVLLAHSQGFDGGISIGFTASQVDGDQSGGYNKPGINGGAWVKTDFNNKAGGQLEIKYATKGSREVNKVSKILTFNILLKYMEVPVIYNYFIDDKFTLQFGLVPEYLFYGEVEDEFGIVANADAEFGKFGLEGLAGFKYNFSDALGGAIRMQYSVLPIMPHPGNQTYFLDRGQFNNLISFSLYYQFGK